ncbi:MAG: glycogen synthase GlgA [Endomicrobiales bacterium]|nr:glycogen synthase GlgA [Endomicrobiales bacterium]
MKILFVTAECSPFVKVGGLADVAGSLPPALKAKKHEVCVVLPKYSSIDEKTYHLTKLPGRLLIPIGKTIEYAFIKTTVLNGVCYYFLENQKYFSRKDVYGEKGKDYPDNRERFIFLSRGALELSKFLGFQPDVIHCNDWQSALIPAYLKTVYTTDNYFAQTASVFTIHNIAYQGIFAPDTIDAAGFSWLDFTREKFEFFGAFNFMKAALVYCDVINTVSSSYAQEILTSMFGCGMEKILQYRKDDLYGILNGIDYQYWSPKTDSLIASNYSKQDLRGKAICKKDLIKYCNLDASDNDLVAGVVSRLDSQKGLDLLISCAQELLNRGVYVVVLGKGGQSLQKKLNAIMKKHKNKFYAHFEFNETLAHQIYAGSDVFLMPSRFEPCGLSQMISLAYGTIPVVFATGGLKDTVKQYNPQNSSGNGFVFDNFNQKSFIDVVSRCAELYKNKAKWQDLMRSTMSCDYSWESSVLKYIDIYSIAMRKVQNKMP